MDEEYCRDCGEIHGNFFKIPGSKYMVCQNCRRYVVDTSKYPHKLTFVVDVVVHAESYEEAVKLAHNTRIRDGEVIEWSPR